jgi:arginyl-tRNA synthetase
MDIENILKKKVKEYLLFKYSISNDLIEISKTRKEFQGHYTIVLFPLLPILKKPPIEIGNEIGLFLQEKEKYIQEFNVIQGFLNLTFSDRFLTDLLKGFNLNYKLDIKKEFYLIEFSSPNTNKPLHLGHIRNILLGDSISNIFKEVGNKVHKTQIINDRGIHICKSMISWLKFANNVTPKSENIKGDIFVGNFYVKYNNEYEKQVKDLISQGQNEDDAKKNSKIFIEAQELLRKWENGDKDVINLWKRMNSWVYDGFSKTYDNLNVKFDSEYYESNTYLKGKNIVLDGLKNKLFYKKEDNSIWVDLSSKGLDEKILLRSDGTSVYITQDIGTAFLRYKDHPKMDGMIYTTGNEQDYHFKVLFELMNILGYPWSNKLKHLSYGMVDLPTGKMKSREGLVVDADELIADMNLKAMIISESLGKINDLSKTEQSKLYNQIALGALKYHILKVDPKKRILFDPNESIDFNGNTGPFIQYTYARIKSLLKKNKNNSSFSDVMLSEKEKNLIIHLNDFPNVILNSYKTLNPALIANYVYDLVKLYNSFYQSFSVLGNDEINSFRILLSKKVGSYIKKSMSLLGIDVPERM